MNFPILGGVRAYLAFILVFFGFSAKRRKEDRKKLLVNSSKESSDASGACARCLPWTEPRSCMSPCIVARLFVFESDPLRSLALCV